jgi:hypothetical protein
VRVTFMAPPMSTSQSMEVIDSVFAKT